MIPLSIYKLRFKVDNSRLGYQDNNAGYRVPDFKILHIVIQHSEIRAHVCFWNYSCIIHLPVLPRPDDQTPPPLPSPLLKLSLPLFHPPQILTHISPKPNLAPQRRPLPPKKASNDHPTEIPPSLRKISDLLTSLDLTRQWGPLSEQIRLFILAAHPAEPHRPAIAVS